MADDLNLTGAPDPNSALPNAQTPPSPMSDDSAIASLPEWAQRTIRDTRREAAEYRTKARAAEEAAKTEREHQLEKQGEWQSLAEQRRVENEALKARAARADAVESTIAESNKRRIAGIPENMRPLVPTDYDPVSLARWLDQSASLLQPKSAPNLNAGAAGEPVGTEADLTPAEREQARKMKIDPKVYAQYKRLA